MSEQPTAVPGGGGKRLFGLPRNVVIIGGVVFVAALGFIFWRRYQANAAAAASNSASTTAASTTGPTDYAGQLSVIQSELEALLAQQGGTGATTGTTTGTGTGTTTPPAGTPVSVDVPDGTGWWMKVTFPSQAALDGFIKAIGATPVPGAGPTGPWYWKPGMGVETIAGFVKAAGGTTGASHLTGYE